MAWTSAQLHTWEAQHRSSSNALITLSYPDSPTISPFNMATAASVQPVRITLLLERTTQDFKAEFKTIQGDFGVDKKNAR